MKSLNDDEIYFDHFYLKSRRLTVFRATYPDGSVILCVSRHDIFDFLDEDQLRKLQTKRKGR